MTLDSRASGPTFHVEWGGEADLTLEEIWPDGDTPANPTREDVIAVMQKAGSLHGLLSEWNLEVEGLEVNGKDSGLR